MKRFALPALLVAVAFFGISSTASAHPGHGGGPGHSHGNGGYGQSFAPGGCYGGGGGYYPRQRGHFVQPRSFGNFGHQYHNHGHNHGFNRGFNQGGIRIRTGNFGFGLRF